MIGGRSVEPALGLCGDRRFRLEKKGLRL